MIEIKRRILIPLLVAVLGFLLGTFLAPLAMKFICWILEPEYYRCAQWNSPEWDQFKQKGE